MNALRTALTRLAYLGVLLTSAAAVYVGLFPSLLTLAALVALPLALVSLIGVISPDAIRRRPRAHRFVRIGTGVLLAQYGFFLVIYVSSFRRHVTIIVHEPVPSTLRVVFDVTDGQPRALRWNRRYVIPASGILYTKYATDFGGYRRREMLPLTILVVSATGDTTEVAGHRRAWGVTKANGCQYSLDEYALGPAPTDHEHEYGSTRASWLDSLSVWGVVCDNGRLRRASVPLK